MTFTDAFVRFGMSILTFDCVLSQVNPFEVLSGFVALILLLALIYHDRPIGVHSAKGRPGILCFEPAYPLVGSLPFILRIATRKTTMLVEILQCQSGPASGGKPFTISFPAMGGRMTVLNNPGYLQYVQKKNFHNFPKGHLQRKHFGDMLGVQGIFVADGIP